MGCSCDKYDCGKKIRVSFCPKCKSRDVKYVFEVRNLFGVMPKMRCGKCGCEMPSFPVLITNKKELDKIAEKVRKKVKKKSGGRKK